MTVSGVEFILGIGSSDELLERNERIANYLGISVSDLPSHMYPETLIQIYEIVGSEFCVGPDDGALVYDEIRFSLDRCHNVVLTFKNVTHLTSDFLDAAVGQLCGAYSQDEFNARVKWIDIEPDDELLLKRVIDNAIRYFASAGI